MMQVLYEVQMLGQETLLGAFAASAGLLLLYFLVLYRREQKLADYPVRINIENKSKRWIEKKAQELIGVEAFRLAGDLMAQLESWEEAALLYKKGGNFIRAAEGFLKNGQTDEAAKAYLESKDFEKAASLFIENQSFQAAARAYLEAGDPLRAARTFARGGDHEKAAQIYLEQGMFRRAAQHFEKVSLWSRAAEALWRSYGQEQTRLPEGVSPVDSMPLRLMARRSGELFYKASRLEKAVEAYQAGGWTLERAQALMEGGRQVEAAEAFLEAGDRLKAAESYEQAGEEKKAAALRAEHYIEIGRDREAVPFLEQAGEHLRAAHILLENEEYAPAAEAFDKAGEHKEAARLFEKQELFERSAQCLEKQEDFQAAASMYARAGNAAAQAEALEKAGDHIAAGSNYFERGLLDKAIEVLQRVEPHMEEYRTASLLLGQIFREKGMLELSIEYFKRSVKDQEMSRSNLERFYQLATCHERMGNADEAARLFENILVLDFHYKDVADRLSAIKRSQTVLDTPSEPSMEDTVSRLEGTGPAPEQPVQSQRYAMLDELGRGGMGIVYKAQDSVLERIVAYKVLPANLKEHPQALKNFFREAKSAARLNHPNIVTVYDAGEEASTYYIAMEYVEGETIKDILNKEGHLPVRAMLIIAGQVCRALEYAHNRKVVHRDIKSSNIMWTHEKQVKLMDFGLAKVIEEVKGYQTIASGTPYYMSPEQTLGRNIDHRTDIYSLGITMFEMATGKLPFMQGDASYHHVHTPPPEAKSINPEVPEELSSIILKCMQKKPEERFQQARELFDAMKKIA